MRLGILAGEVMHVVGGDKLQAVCPCKSDKGFIGRLLVRKGVVHQLDIDVLPPEDVDVLSQRPLGLLDVVLQDVCRDLAGKAGRERDEVL